MVRAPFAVRASRHNPSRHIAFGRLDDLQRNSRDAGLLCESDLETLMNFVKAQKVAFSRPVDAGKWGMKIVSIEQMFPAPEEYGLRFNVTVAGHPIGISGFEAPGFLYQAAYHAVEAVVVETLEKREQFSVVTA